MVALLAALAIGAIYQAIATEIDQREAFPGPGEMVDVGEHRLHINCVGQGSPTVVRDAGWGYTSVEWSAWVQPGVAKHTRVCAYDRAGMGWSEPEPGAPNATQTTAELHALLREADEEGPYTSWSATPSPASTLASTPIVIPRTWRGWCWWTPPTPTSSKAQSRHGR